MAPGIGSFLLVKPQKPNDMLEKKINKGVLNILPNVKNMISRLKDVAIEHKSCFKGYIRYPAS